MLICLDQRTGIGCGTENRDGAQFCGGCGKSLRFALQLRNPGDVVNGRYRIVRVIGHGGFGAVYEAEDAQQPGERVALKETFDPAEIQHYRAEFAVLSALAHPHLPRYFEVFEANGNGYLVMEYVPGQSLADVLNKQGGPLLETVVLGYALQLCDALSFLHDRTPPIIHRDIKPANVRLTPEGLIKLVDFGLVKQGTGATVASRRAVTPAYAPPEQWGMGGQHTEPRSDIYALGATLYHLLTGVEPASAMDRNAISPDPLLIPRSVNRGLSGKVSDAIVTAMSIRIEQRPANAEALSRFLSRGSAQAPPLPPPIVPKPVPPQPAPPQPAPPKPAPPQPAPPKPAPPKPAPPKPAHGFGISWSTMIAIALGIGLLIGILTALDGFSALSRPSPARTIQVAPATSTPAARAGDSNTWTEPTTGMEFVRAPAGEFTMGSDSGFDDEKPPHRVTVGDYWIGLTEVTNAQFRPFVEGGGYADRSLWTGAGWKWRTENGVTQPLYWDDAEWNRPGQPVVGVSWHEAVAYSRWLTRAAGWEFRLPTEAEWEKACRGLDERTYPWGEAPPNADLANTNNNLGGTTAVGSYPSGAAPSGALDMAGNVWEWTGSLYEPYPYDATDGREDPEASGTRSLRGGAFYLSGDLVRCAYRGNFGPVIRYDVVIGFRVVSPGF